MQDKRRLYSRWMSTLSAHGNDVALFDLGSGQKLTFLELNKLLQDKPTTNNPVTAQFSGVDFVIRTLWAWREGVAFIPIDDSTQFDMARLDGIPDEIAHVKQTSGTTGEPRLILFTAAQMEADADQIVSSMKLASFDCNIGVISVVHSYGFSSLILPLLLHGIPLILGKSPLPESLNHAFSEVLGRAILPAVPAMWNAWHKSGVLENSPVELAISAGAPLSADTEKGIFISCGLKVHNFYGSSECGGIAYDCSHDVRRSCDIVGRPLKGVVVDYVENGRLIVKSAATAFGYWPPDPSGDIVEDSFLTSDLAEPDIQTGEIRLMGRISEVINVAGRKLSPNDIEEVMMGISGIRICIAFGIPSKDEHRVEDVVACFSAREAMDHKQLASEMLSKLPAWKVPRIFWQQNGLAVSSRGKVSRRHWRQQFLAWHQSSISAKGNHSL